MARLPQPGGDNGTWGDVLNEYLSQVHKADGFLKDDAVTTSAIAPDAITATEIQNGSITEAQLSSGVQTKLNATAGTPSWDDISNKPSVIAAGADQAAARAAIGAGTSSLTIGTTASTAKAGDYAPTKTDLGLGNVDNTSDDSKPISIATQTELDGKAALNHTHTATGISDSTATGRALLTATDAATVPQFDWSGHLKPIACGQWFCRNSCKIRPWPQ